MSNRKISGNDRWGSVPHFWHQPHCPRCGKSDEKLQASCRWDSSIRICEMCGREEAINLHAIHSLVAQSQQKWTHQDLNDLVRLIAYNNRILRIPTDCRGMRISDMIIFWDATTRGRKTALQKRIQQLSGDESLIFGSYLAWIAATPRGGLNAQHKGPLTRSRLRSLDLKVR